MKKDSIQNEEKSSTKALLHRFWQWLKAFLRSIYQRLRQWPLGWLINLGLTILVLILLLVMLITYRQGEKALVQKKEETVQQTSVVDTYLAQMTLEEKVGQLFMARVPVVNQLEDLETYHLGGYLLFAEDMAGENLDSLKEKIASYQAAATTPLLIGSDEEGGQVSRLSTILDEPLAQPQALFEQGGLSLVLEDVREKAELLSGLGLHTGFFPVADIATDVDAFIYPRTLGQDVETTKSYVAQTTKILQENQLISTLKHFPGYGNNGDSHYDLIYDYRSLAELQELDLQVFAAGIQAGSDSVLITHNIFSEIDGLPASLSPEINRILRQDLGFDGVAMTDDFDMEGLAAYASQEEAAFMAIQAGNDLILTSQYASQIPYLLDRIATGDLTEERIDESVRRILRMKEKLGLLPATVVEQVG